MRWIALYAGKRSDLYASDRVITLNLVFWREISCSSVFMPKSRVEAISNPFKACVRVGRIRTLDNINLTTLVTNLEIKKSVVEATQHTKLKHSYTYVYRIKQIIKIYILLLSNFKPESVLF